jgi:hypothetical protein
MPHDRGVSRTEGGWRRRGVVTWTTADDLKAQIQRLWDRGDLLRAVVSPPSGWPLRLTLRRPTASDLSGRFDAVRQWSQALATTPHVRIEWNDWNHRVQGRQRLPAEVWIDSPFQAIAWLGEQEAVDRFGEIAASLRGPYAPIHEWLVEAPHDALGVFDEWERLLGVVAWMLEHPRPAVYLRHVDVPGVDTKFIEAHSGVLSAMLDRALPADAIDHEARGVAQFRRRYGFAEPPRLVRFRALDRNLGVLPGVVGMCDVTLDAASFAALHLPVERVIIVENETSFLALPAIPRAIGLFGAGYGWETVAGADWLGRCRVQYWGDLDTHGFAILHQLRARLPHVASVLMDRGTLLAHRLFWGVEAKPVRHELAHLTPDEAAVYDDLRHDRYRAGVRLEQERIGFRWVERQLSAEG